MDLKYFKQKCKNNGETHHKNCNNDRQGRWCCLNAKDNKKMGLSDIKDLVSTAFQAGRMDAQFEVGLRPKKVCRVEAENYIASKGFRKADLDRWVKNRLVTEFVGEKINSPRYYSLSEINEMLVSMQLKKII